MSDSSSHFCSRQEFASDEVLATHVAEEHAGDPDETNHKRRRLSDSESTPTLTDEETNSDTGAPTDTDSENESGWESDEEDELDGYQSEERAEEPRKALQDVTSPRSETSPLASDACSTKKSLQAIRTQSEAPRVREPSDSRQADQENMPSRVAPPSPPRLPRRLPTSNENCAPSLAAPRKIVAPTPQPSAPQSSGCVVDRQKLCMTRPACPTTMSGAQLTRACENTPTRSCDRAPIARKRFLEPSPDVLRDRTDRPVAVAAHSETPIDLLFRAAQPDFCMLQNIQPGMELQPSRCGWSSRQAYQSPLKRKLDFQLEPSLLLAPDCAIPRIADAPVSRHCHTLPS